MEWKSFFEGQAFDAYTRFGAHPMEQGVRFCTWAPAAVGIEVIGEWNSWRGEPMNRVHPGGIWECICDAAETGQMYKYRIHGGDGSLTDHCDPYGFYMELRPASASIIQGLPAYSFADADWMARRTKNFDAPLHIYELHAGSWRRKPDGGWYSYSELAEFLPAYARENGYTHIELMPLAEHPFDGSWGYQTTGFYAPTSRFGIPAELAGLVDACHIAGIGVILDFVPVHFAADPYGLRRFDGTALYEYPNQAVGESEWGSCNFMHSRGEICCFLQSCADYWLRHFHFDGLRMDAVSRLLYWQGDPGRGVNGGAVRFLQNMNVGLQRRFPSAMLIAEDSTSYPKVTAPVEYGGLGFDYKWDLGWMNDTLDYLKKPPEERRHAFDRLAFSMAYFWQEHYILPFSHDENVHGKATILQKMCGGYKDKFPQGRALYLYMFVHPGKKLDFMGNELGQLREWDETREQDWSLLDYPVHQGFFRFRRCLHQLYLDHEALWFGEYDPSRFSWVACPETLPCVCAMLRRGKSEVLLGIFNFGPEGADNLLLTVPGYRTAEPLLDSSWADFGGEKVRQRSAAAGENGAFHLSLSPYSGQLYRLNI